MSRQDKMYEFIRNFHAEHKKAPRNKDICNALGLQPGLVTMNAYKLASRGLIKFEPHRTIELVEDKAA